MRTQKHDLKDEILHLEIELVKAKLNKDYITQLSINKRLDDAKSTLINIRKCKLTFHKKLHRQNLMSIHIG